ncbi:DNA polymerase I [Candidatus Dojkabacteria bacterium]|nr:DNA polymerase I [Candidatus Dojkabacteria bacterium]
MTDKATFVLIDAHAIIHRAYHAFPATLRDKKGEQVNAVYGFSRILIEVIQKFKPKYLICAFDSKGPTFRHEKYSEYKAQRKKLDNELIEQFPKVRDIVKAFNIPVIALQGYEADDILGTVVTNKQCADMEKIIVTGDHDLLQLMVYPNIKVYISGTSFSKSMLYDVEAVKTRYKFGPEFITDYKGLRGDTSDNIPGVKGVGEKTATDLILNFGHLEDVYSSLDKISSQSVKKKLESSHEIALLSKDLATIEKNVDVEFDIAKSEFADFNEQEVKDIFTEYSFYSLIDKIPKSKNNNTQVPNSKSQISNNDEYRHLITEGEITEFLKELKKQKVFAFDTETTGVNYFDSKLLGISFSWEKSRGYFIDLDSDSITQEHIKDLKDVFENPEIKKVGHNIKFDGHMLANKTVKGLELGIHMQNYFFDTMVAQYLLTGSQGRVGLKALALSECGMELAELHDLWKDVAIKVKKYYSKEEVEYMMLQLDKSKLAKYASMDADATWRLYELLDKRFEENLKLKNLFYKIEMTVIPILVEMENSGIKLDVKYLQGYGNLLEKQLEEIKTKIYATVGHEFNIASAKQVGEVLFDELQLPGGKKTKTGAWQTNESILKSYKNINPIIDLLLEYREISKMLSTYVSSLIDEAKNPQERIHTNYNQTIASTGRLSSTQPNLQNIPISSEVGRKIRQAFIADKGKKLISFDISQQELRILAHLSKEEKLIEAFKNGVDIHRNTASMLFKIDEDKITKKQRDTGKTLNYSLIYGISAYGLSDRLKIHAEEAQELIARYFTIYPKVKEYFDNLLLESKKSGRVETLYGRYRSAVDLNNSNFRVRNATEREVINFPIQGSASDLMKLAMIKVDKFLKADKKYKNLNPRMLLQVHDELVFEVDDSTDISDFCKEVIEIMSHVGELIVPMNVEFHIGSNWAETK